MVKIFYTNIRLKTGKLDVVQRMKCIYDSDLRVYTQFSLGITSWFQTRIKWMPYLKYVTNRV